MNVTTPSKRDRLESSCTSEKTSVDMERSGSSTRVGSFVDAPMAPQRTNSTVECEAFGSLAAPDEPDHVKPKTFREMWPTNPRAYLCLFGGFLQMFVSWGYVNAFGTYASYYRSHLLPTSDDLLMNLIGSTECFVILLVSLVVGRLVDAGHIGKVLFTGTILLAAGTFSLSGVNSAAEYGDGNFGGIWATQGFLTSLGMACHFVSSSQVVATWFVDTKSFAVGVVACGASIGGAVISAMVRFLNRDEGFNTEARYVAALVTGLSAITFIICRPNPEHLLNKTQKWRLSTFWDRNAFNNPCFCWMSAAVFFIFLGFYPVFFNLEEWAASNGVAFRTAVRPDGVSPSAIETFALLSMMNGASFVGRLVSAGISDHLGVFGALHVHFLATVVASILLMAQWTTANTVGKAIAFVLVFGIFSGAVIGLPPASMAFIIGKTDKKAQAKLGQWVGMMYSMASIPALIGPIIAGHLISKFDTFLTVQFWSGASLLLAATCMCVAMYYERRQRHRRGSMVSYQSSKGILGGLQRKEG